MLGWRLFAAAAGATTVLAETYTVVLGAQSPALTYVPEWEEATYAEESAWNGMYTHDYDFSVTKRFGQPGRGNQIMWNTGNGGNDAPRVKYAFSGTGIAFRGYWGAPVAEGSSSAAVEVIVDGHSTTFSGVDGGTEDLVTLANVTVENGSHDVELVLRRGDVSLLFVDVTLDFPDIPLKTIRRAEAEAATQASAMQEAYGTDTSPAIIFGIAAGSAQGTERVPNPDISTTGNWRNPAGNNTEVLYPVIVASERDASATAHLGSGNFFVRINGSLKSENDRFGITLTPPPPGRPATVTGYSFAWPWTGNGTLFMAALDPAVEYNATLQNLQTLDTGEVDVHSFELWKGERDPTKTQNPLGESSEASSTPAEKEKGKSGSQTASVAGGVVGGLLGLVILGILVFFVIRRKRKQREYHPKETTFEIEDHTYERPTVQSMLPTPYPAEMPTPQPLSYTNPPPVKADSRGAYTRLSVAEASTPRTSVHLGPLPDQPSASDSTESFEQELDAGALIPPVPAPKRVVPPSYVPSWATATTTSPEASAATSSVGDAVSRNSVIKS